MKHFDPSIWRDGARGRRVTGPGAAGPRVGGLQFRLKAGQRFHRTGFPAVIWRVVTVYHDHQGLEHATLEDEGRRLDEKTLSASALFDRSQYRLV